MSTDISFSGPLFDGRAAADLERGGEQISADGASRAAQLARSAFGAQIRHGTGRFLASITTADRSRDITTQSGRHTYTMPVTADRGEEIATTDNAAYGPWLEGTGSRNDSTRFKGYHGFRMASEQLDREAGQIADRALEPYVREMNA